MPEEKSKPRLEINMSYFTSDKGVINYKYELVNPSLKIENYLIHQVRDSIINDGGSVINNGRRTITIEGVAMVENIEFLES